MFALAPIAGLLLAAVPALGQASGLIGTWSTGSQAVVTGPGFANPANMSFTYPKTAGISFSFTTDNYYEIARYRFVSNGSQPTCITGVMNWVHGTYVVNPNNSISLTPLGDGYQQIQDPCAAVSNFVENYNMTEYYQSFAIYTDPTTGQKLHLFQFDGTPYPPMFQVSTSPNMLPTQMLRNVTPALTTSDGLVSATKRSLPTSNSGERRWSVISVGGLAVSVFGMALGSMLL
ncbi:hypothetical protein PLICRDRAFT_52694 [Plicaturopsis crispa FD-325 SS-3]|nr:hypothetical protein PLICRDRAFT_52694 [Plicaturopsis crispa FD-325 SS-3]